MPPDESKPLFAQVGRSATVQASAGSRALLTFVAVGLVVALVSFLWELRLGTDREPPPVKVTDMAAQAAEAEADLDARISAGEDVWSVPPDPEAEDPHRRGERGGGARR